MLQNLPIMLFGISLIFYLLAMLVFMLSGLHYADNMLIIYLYLIVYFCRLSVKMIIIGMNNCIVKKCQNLSAYLCNSYLLVFLTGQPLKLQHWIMLKISPIMLALYALCFPAPICLKLCQHTYVIDSGILSANRTAPIMF